MSIRDFLTNLIRSLFGPSPIPIPSPPQTEIYQLLNLHNSERSRMQITPLQVNWKLSVAAQKHANWMATNKTLNHNENGITFSTRLSAEDYHFWNAGENIAMGQPTVQSVMTAWMNSSGHRANILSIKFRDVGFGMAENEDKKYWCVDFGSIAAAVADSYEPSISLAGPLGPIQKI